MNIYEGRPGDTAGRSEKEIAAYDMLDALGIAYKRADHEVAMTMEDCVAIGEALGAHICKNLFLCNRQKTDFYLLLMPGDKIFKTKELSSQINSARLSFAGPEELAQYLNLTPGSATVLGLAYDKECKVRLLIDKDLLAMEWFGCHPCMNTSSIAMKTKDMLEKFLPSAGHDYTEVTLVGE